MVHVFCVGVDEQLASKDTRQKRKILKLGGGAASGVLPITKRHPHLNDDGSSGKS